MGEEVLGLGIKTTGIEIRAIGYRDKFLAVTLKNKGLTNLVTCIVTCITVCITTQRMLLL
jgi:hypothetical protein